MAVHDYEILYFAARGDIERVQSCLTRGIDPNTRDDSGYTPLHWAVQSGNLDMARILIENRADVNVRDEHGHSPLWNAISEGQTELANLLLDHGADHRDGLICAAAWGRGETADVLIKKDTPVDYRDEDGCTPIYYASLNGHFDLVTKLLDAGANPGIANSEGILPADAAFSQGHHEIASLLRGKHR
jgi:uncharacterized protein